MKKTFYTERFSKIGISASRLLEIFCLERAAIASVKARVKAKMVYVILFLFFFSQNLNAQSCLALSEILALTLVNNPQLNSYNYDMRAADARTLQASFRPNPGLDVLTENFGAHRFMQTTFMLSQLIEMGGKRQARVAYARSERERVNLDYEVQKRQLFVDTALLFIDVLISQLKIAFFQQNLNILQNFSSVVEKRVKAGKASVIEEANFTVTLNTARIDLQNALNELKIKKSKLAAQWGEPQYDSFEVTGILDWIPTVIPLSDMGELILEHPQIVRSYYEENLRAAKISLEKSKASPNVNLGGGPRYLEEAHKWVWVVGASVPLPINDRNQGGIWESKENFEKLDREREALWTKLLTELNTTYVTTQTVFSELNLLEETVLPAAQRAYEFSYKGYELARYNYLEFLETERAYRTSKIRYLNALGEYHKALALLQGLTGSTAIINQQCESNEK